MELFSTIKPQFLISRQVSPTLHSIGLPLHINNCTHAANLTDDESNFSGHQEGIDSLAVSCRKILSEDPFSGNVFALRNRKKTAIKLLVYDGQEFWLLHKKLSKRKFFLKSAASIITTIRMCGVIWIIAYAPQNFGKSKLYLAFAYHGHLFHFSTIGFFHLYRPFVLFWLW